MFGQYFVGDTEIVIGVIPEGDVVAEPELNWSIDIAASREGLWFAALAGAIISIAARNENKRRKREKEDFMEAVFDEDESDGFSSDKPEPTITDTSIDSLCDRLFADDATWSPQVDASNQASQAVERSTSSQDPELDAGQAHSRTDRCDDGRGGTAAHSSITRTLGIGLLLLAATLSYFGAFPARKPIAASPLLTATFTTDSREDRKRSLRSRPIQEIRVGHRIAGRNPLREQAEQIEPDSETWRKIDLFMPKENGRGLWIELLRPLDWIEEHDANPGRTIFLDMSEMGAVGEAEVTAVGPCPEIEPGEGTVVTGTFKHQADANSNVVSLKLEDQVEPTKVTEKHPYWSVDRQEYVAVGLLRTGEVVDTEFGLKRVVSITPVKHDGYLYNLETTEHVYRVGSLGALVHNSCVQFTELSVWRNKIGDRSREFTLAKLEIGGQDYFGKSFGKRIDEAYPFANVNNISKFHAEGDVIGQALRDGVRAKEATIFIDRTLCRSCGDLNGLRNMAQELGIKRLHVFEKLNQGVSVSRIDF